MRVKTRWKRAAPPGMMEEWSGIGQVILRRAGAWNKTGPLFFTAHGGRGYVFLGFFGVVHGVASAFDGVVKVVFVDVEFRALGGKLGEFFKKFLGARDHQVDP